MGLNNERRKWENPVTTAANNYYKEDANKIIRSKEFYF